MNRKVVSSPKAPVPIGPYEQGIVMDGLLFTSGQIGVDPATGRLVEGGVEMQAETVFRSLLAILEEAGSSPQHVLKVNLYLRNLEDFSKVNEIYRRFFGDKPPARTTVEVSGLPMGAAMEADLVARVPQGRRSRKPWPR
ncbi:MAG: Rid family detoxifying hydrolase [Thermodesulfobacteriota bacterium]